MITSDEGLLIEAVIIPVTAKVDEIITPCIFSRLMKQRRDAEHCPWVVSVDGLAL